jgi:cysteine desulfurase
MRAYFDHNATTPVDAAVLGAMLPYFSPEFGNASSIHSEGQRARMAIEDAREAVAALIGAQSRDIIFTSGGTEANNLAIFGVLSAARRAGNGATHVITSSIEHPSVLQACEELQRRGVDVCYVEVSKDGLADPDDVRRAIRPTTVLVSIMHANNEVGTIQPIAEIARIAAEAGAHFHTDAVQSAGKIKLNVNEMGVDLLSLSAHKIYGPKGVGALYVRAGTPLEHIQFGGHHERDRRPGTENVPGIVGLGEAAQLAAQRQESDAARMRALRDRFEKGIMERVPYSRINGSPEGRVPNTTNMIFPYAEGESLCIALDLAGIACSTGAACSSGAVEPSHALTAMGLNAEEARSSLRFSFGRGTREEEIDFALKVIPAAVERLRQLSPVYPGAAERA